jgi:hypothetical protein
MPADSIPATHSAPTEMSASSRLEEQLPEKRLHDARQIQKTSHFGLGAVRFGRTHNGRNGQSSKAQIEDNHSASQT